ncbi:MAG: aspartyl-tRNA(Asn)/glutamyl-tRNA(Gln) amidotransferase subunit A [Myxococcota bacterium]|jgi:aspartyl-tRNA(Asn)/glutamyl-tRNA(Gln) amidotransferase subunit A
MMFRSVEETRAANVRGEDAVGTAVAAIATENPATNAFIALDPAPSRGESGLLAGIPIAIKDNMVMRGLPTTAASRILEGFESPYDGTVVSRLRAAGASIVGKTNLDEFAMGSSTENSAYGATRNPHDLTRVPGGSSGGSAAAVAAGMVPIAYGSDTGGSIRQPAALCGVFGLKPTWGRVSRYGLIAFASSLDQIGPFARNTADLALGLQVIAGHDPLDSTSSALPVPDYSAELESGVAGLRIGVPAEYFGDGLDPAIADAVRRALAGLQAAGATLVDVSLPEPRHSLAAYYVIAPAEASSNLARYDGVRYGKRVVGGDLAEMYARSRTEGFGSEVIRRIMLGTYALSSGYYDEYYGRAQRARTLLRRGFDAAFEQCDVIATPTSPVIAPHLGDKTDDPLAMYLMDVYTISANLAGLPGLSAPCGLVEGMPVGLQLLGPAFGESALLRVSAEHERLSGSSPRPGGGA